MLERLGVGRRPPPIHALAISSTYRTLDNFRELLDRIVAEGGTVRLGLFPFVHDPSVPRFGELPFDRAFTREMTAWSDSAALPESEAAALLDTALASGVNVILLSDLQSYPSNAIKRIVARRAAAGQSAPLIIGFQHGVFQAWHLYNENFACDNLFCFGRAHVLELAPEHQAHASAVGLCKLDRLKNVAIADAGYTLFIAQKVPGPDAVVPALRAYEEQTRRAVVIRDHPQFPGRYDFPVTQPEFAETRERWAKADLNDALANCTLAISTHSTAAIEALYLKKPVVLLPNHGLSAFHKYPAIAQDFTGEAIAAALGQTRVLAHRVTEYIEDAVGGIHFDHTEGAYRRLLELHARREV